MQVEIALTPGGVAASFAPTETGEAAVPLGPLRLVYEYLGMLARAPPRHCWDELKTAAEAEFRCTSATSARRRPACQLHHPRRLAFARSGRAWLPVARLRFPAARVRFNRDGSIMTSRSGEQIVSRRRHHDVCLAACGASRAHLG